MKFVLTCILVSESVMLGLFLVFVLFVFFFKQKTAYEMRISDWSSDVCSSDLSLHLACGGGWREIHPLPPESLSDETGQGIAHGYVVIDGEAHLIGGAGTDGYRLLYHKGVPALSDVETTNWLLTREPGLYLYGALTEASPYVADDARTLLWATQYKAIVDRMLGEDEMARYGNGPSMAVRFNAP